MRLIPPELTSAVLTMLGLGGAWLATWLARRGKKEDVKIAERGQAFDQLLELAATRLAEITRLSTERDTANTERERVRTSWEDRWDRQMKRCREVTDSLVGTISQLRDMAGDEGKRKADDALRVVGQHNERDHTPDDV